MRLNVASLLLLGQDLKSAVTVNKRRDCFKCLSSRMRRGGNERRPAMTDRPTDRPSGGWALTKVQELLHGQGRRAELGEALHLFRGAENGAVFHQKLGELHFGSLSPTSSSSPTVRERSTQLSFFLHGHAPLCRAAKASSANKSSPRRLKRKKTLQAAASHILRALSAVLGGLTRPEDDAHPRDAAAERPSRTTSSSSPQTCFVVARTGRGGARVRVRGGRDLSPHGQ